MAGSLHSNYPLKSPIFFCVGFISHDHMVMDGRKLSIDGPTIPKPAFLGCRKNVGPSMIEPFLVGCLGKSMKIHTGPIQKWSQKRASMSCIVLPSLGLLLGFLRKSQRLSILVVGIPLESAARFFWDHRNCPKSFHQLMVHAMVPWLSRFG